MNTIDLNCDMGELKPGQNSNFDHEIMPYISSCNVSCGFHSGDATSIDKTIRFAVGHDVAIGAHPSYDDRAHFGRRSLKIDPHILMGQLRYQISAIKGICESLGTTMKHIKPHGALYNDMSHDLEMTKHFIELVQSIDPEIKVFALAHSPMINYCKEQGLHVVAEGFADRCYQQIDALRSRSLDGAVLHDTPTVLAQVSGLIDGTVTLHDQSQKPISVQSICLHSDTQGAVQLSQKIYHHVRSLHVEVAPN